MNLLLLQVVLARAAGLAAGKGALVVALAGVDTRVSGEVAAGGKGTLALVAGVAAVHRGGREGGRGGVHGGGGGGAVWGRGCRGHTGGQGRV